MAGLVILTIRKKTMSFTVKGNIVRIPGKGISIVCAKFQNSIRSASDLRPQPSQSGRNPVPSRRTYVGWDDEDHDDDKDSDDGDDDDDA